MNIKGKVVQVLPLEGGTSKSGNAWSKASVIVETAENPQYPKTVKLSNMKKAEEFAKIAVGGEYEFKVEIESREYNGRWYTEVSCWGWNSTQNGQASQPPAQTGYPQQQPQPPTKKESDELPF